eukprot:7387259-Prymnesium_polylepis.1
MDSVKRDDVNVADFERAEPKVALAMKHEGRTVAPGAPDPAQSPSRVWTKDPNGRFLSTRMSQLPLPAQISHPCEYPCLDPVVSADAGSLVSAERYETA